MARQPIPSRLSGRAFAFREAVDLGLTPARLRARDVQNAFRGARSIGLDLADVLDRCRAFEPVLRDGQAFSHTTALALHGIPTAPEDVIHVSVPFPRTPPRGVGVAGHSIAAFGVELRSGLPVVSPSEAWVQSAAVSTEEDLVVAGDALVTGPRVNGARIPALLTESELAAALAAGTRRPGAERARWALARIRSGVDSPAETRLRMALVGSRLPEPVVDHPIRVRPDLVLHADLAYPAARVAIEYEGDLHRRNRTRWQRDIERRELVEDAGWRTVRVTADQLRDPSALILRLRRLLTIRASGS